LEKWTFKLFANYIIVLISLILATYLHSHSQTWTQITSGTVQNIWGLELISSTNAYAVGDQGTILFSSNSGDTWTSQASGTTSFLNSIRFLNTNLGWAVGENGTILKTTNSGTNWTYQNNGSGATIGGIGIFGIQDIVTVAGSGDIRLSTDGGDTWNPVSPVTVNDLWSIKTINQTIAFAVGDGGTIIKTIDGGLSWSTQTSGSTDLLWDIDFYNGNIGYAVGDNGVILKTLDGGVNWNPQSSAFVGSLYSIFVKDENTAYAVGVSGKILKTTNGGTNWIDEPSGSSEALTRIKFFGTTGIITGQNGEILKYNLFPPTLSSITSSNLTTSSISLNSSISSDGNTSITDKGFVLSTSSNPTINSNNGLISSGSGSGAFSENISGLSNSTIYYARAYATNSEGTSYSNQITFTTLSTENLPNNGDGNGDGIVDSLQNNVVTILTADGNNYLTIEEVDGRTLYDVNTLESNDLNNSIFYPYGLVEFKINASTSTIKIYYHNTDYFKNMIYKKLRSNGSFINFPNYETSFELINGNQVAVIILTLSDGGLGDYDGVVNGIIYDPGGPALPISANIPIWDWWYALLLIPTIIFAYKKFT